MLLHAGTKLWVYCTNNHQEILNGKPDPWERHEWGRSVWNQPRKKGDTERKKALLWWEKQQRKLWSWGAQESRGAWKADGRGRSFSLFQLPAGTHTDDKVTTPPAFTFCLYPPASLSVAVFLRIALPPLLQTSDDSFKSRSEKHRHSSRPNLCVVTKARRVEGELLPKSHHINIRQRTLLSNILT